MNKTELTKIKAEVEKKHIMARIATDNSQQECIVVSDLYEILEAYAP